MDFRMRELMIVALPEGDENVVDTCCAASCSACTNCTRTRAPTPGLDLENSLDRHSALLTQLKERLREQRALV